MVFESKLFGQLALTAFTFVAKSRLSSLPFALAHGFGTSWSIRLNGYDKVTNRCCLRWFSISLGPENPRIRKSFFKELSSQGENLQESEKSLGASKIDQTLGWSSFQKDTYLFGRFWPIAFAEKGPLIFLERSLRQRIRR